MFRRLICKLNCETSGITRKIRGDTLQGVLMEHINSDYAAKLHLQGLNPYSQYYDSRGGRALWIIQTMNETAGREIIDPLASNKFTGFHLDRLNADITISEKDHSHIAMADLVKQYYFKQSGRIFHVNFITPTAFKSNGEYVFFPDIRLIFGSLMRKYAAVCENTAEADEKTLISIVENAKIISYSLKSTYSVIGTTRLPAFRGLITIKAQGAPSLINYIHFLLTFGEYSGVGVKCSMGMGAIEVL